MLLNEIEFVTLFEQNKLNIILTNIQLLVRVTLQIPSVVITEKEYVIVRYIQF